MVDLQKTQVMMDDKLTLMDMRLGNLEEILHGYKESFENMQQMMTDFTSREWLKEHPILEFETLQRRVVMLGYSLEKGSRLKYPDFT